jgi:hypothetical protein
MAGFTADLNPKNTGMSLADIMKAGAYGAEMDVLNRQAAVAREKEKELPIVTGFINDPKNKDEKGNWDLDKVNTILPTIAPITGAEFAKKITDGVANHAAATKAKLELSNNIPNYLSDEYILVNASLFASEASPDLIREYVCEISDFLMANNKSKVGLNIISEGLAFNSIGTSNKIIKEFLEQHNKMPSSFTFIFGASPCTKNINYYKAYCKRFNWFEIPIIFVNWWEYYFSGKINEENSIYSTITTTPSIKSKKFLCYNRNPKPHRLYITTECIKRDLIKDAYISNYFKFPEDEFNFGSTYEWFPTLYQEMHDLMYEHKDKFPLDLGLASIPKVKVKGLLIL